MEAAKKCREDFPFFARTCLKLIDKEGVERDFILNDAQQYAEARAQDMLQRKGFVRLIVLKGRQQGISTWAQGRAYHKTSLWSNQSAFVLSHHGDTSENIFAITEHYHLKNPLAPATGASNARELSFARMNSSYEVTTAGSKEVGRGGTRQFFHGSEVAFWENATGHFKASVNSIALAPNTWVILESTAHGVDGEFYRRWQNAVAGIGDYEAVFIPWFWQSEYRRHDLVTPDFELSQTSPALGLDPDNDELTEAQYAEMYRCDMAQMAWRRQKVIDEGLDSFKQEYPATAEEAFQSANKGSYIPAKAVMMARKRKVETDGPLIMGVDPAGPDGDRFTIARRIGSKCLGIEYRRVGYVEAVEWMKDEIDRHNPAAVFIDAGGLGAPLIAFLRAKGPKYDAVVHSVNFGGTSQSKMANKKKAGPVNRRAEMWQRMKNWLENVDEPPQIPDGDLGDALQGDLTCVKAKPETNNNLLLQSKSDLKSKGFRSPDFADALALTFASTVYAPDAEKKSPMEQALLDRPPEVGYDGFNGTHPTGWMS